MDVLGVLGAAAGRLAIEAGDGALKRGGVRLQRSAAAGGVLGIGAVTAGLQWVLIIMVAVCVVLAWWLAFLLARDGWGLSWWGDRGQWPSAPAKTTMPSGIGSSKRPTVR